jgi:hypothetical protein
MCCVRVTTSDSLSGNSSCDTSTRPELQKAQDELLIRQKKATSSLYMTGVSSRARLRQLQLGRDDCGAAGVLHESAFVCTIRQTQQLT